MKMKKHMTQEVAIKSAWMILEGLGFSREINGDLEKTVTAVYESAPAADVMKVRHGRWITKNVDGSWRVDTCSVCNKDTHYVRFAPEYDYCPDCGAKMDGGRDDG